MNAHEISDRELFQCYERGKQYRRTFNLGSDTACPYMDGTQEAKWWKQGWADENGGL